MINRINTYRSHVGKGRVPSQAELERRLRQWKKIEEDAFSPNWLDAKNGSNISLGSILDFKGRNRTWGGRFGQSHHHPVSHSKSSPLETDTDSHSPRSLGLRVRSVLTSPSLFDHNHAPPSLSRGNNGRAQSALTSPPGQTLSQSTSHISLSNFSSASDKERGTQSPLQQLQTPVTITLTSAPQQVQGFVFPGIQQSLDGQGRAGNTLAISSLRVEREKHRSNFSASGIDPLLEEESDNSSEIPSSMDVFMESYDTQETEDGQEPPEGKFIARKSVYFDAKEVTKAGKHVKSISDQNTDKEQKVEQENTDPRIPEENNTFERKYGIIIISCTFTRGS